MKRILSLILTFAMLLTASVYLLPVGAGAAAYDSSELFVDVPENAWYKQAVDFVTARGIMTGAGRVDTFKPEYLSTRAMVAVILHRLEGEPEASSVSPFADLKQSWYIPAAHWAYETEIVKGSSATKFNPNGNVTRQEFVTMLYRYAEYKGLDTSARQDTSTFPDASKVASWAKDAMEWGLAIGLISGRSEGGKINLAPKGNTQRSEMASMFCRFLEKKTEADGYTKGLAEIRIETETGRDVESKEDYIRASFTLKGQDGRDIDEGSMRIRGRGNSTWMMEKKSYRLKFDDSICLMSKDSGGDTENKDWTLLANHCDKSLIRNHLALSLGRELDGIPWSPYTELVHVYLNGEYHGVYMLSEQVEVGEKRVEIEEGEKDDIGILIELDNYAEEEGEYLIDYINAGGKMYSIKSDIKSKDQGIALKVHLETLMNVLREGDRTKIEATVDVDSAVDMFLLQELMLNGDVGYSSFFMYFDSPHGKLHFTAPWDFDLSTGNTYQFTSPEIFHTAHQGDANGGKGGTVNYWLGALMSQQWFREEVRDRFNEKGVDLLRVIDEVTEYAYVNIEDFDLNFDRWDIHGKRVNQEPENVLKLKNCAENIAFLKGWLVDRYGWLKKQFNTDWFIADYDLVPEEDKAYGRTDIVPAGNAWIIPDWFEGYSEVQIIVDTMRIHGIVQLELGRASTMSPEAIERRVLVEQMGLTPGRYKFEFDMGDYAQLLSNYQGVGFDDAAHYPIDFVLVDTVTGDRSAPTQYVFHVTKRDLTVIWPD